MATFSTALRFGLLGLLGTSASPPMIRRHDGDVAVNLDAAGEVTNVPLQTALERVPISEHGATASLFDSGPEDTEEDYCNVDYPLGQPDTNNCTDFHLHELILDEGACITAAEDSRATVHDPTFRIPREFKDTRPRGCFAAECNEGVLTSGETAGVNGTGSCFFYNPIPDFPLAPKGVPICTRPKYLKGTTNTNGLLKDCPDGYSVVTDEEKCHKIAECLNHEHGDPFRIGETNNSKHDEYPGGCFIGVDDKMYFNPLYVNFMYPPTAPVGTPICNVSKFTKCVGAQCMEMVSTAIVSAHEHTAAAGANASVGTGGGGADAAVGASASAGAGAAADTGAGAEGAAGAGAAADTGAGAEGAVGADDAAGTAAGNVAAEGDDVDADAGTCGPGDCSGCTHHSRGEGSDCFEKMTPRDDASYCRVSADGQECEFHQDGSYKCYGTDKCDAA